MGFLFRLIGGKTKLYALAAVVFALGLLGWRKAGIKAALEREHKKGLQRRLDAAQAKKEIDREAETQDDTSLIDRIRRK